MQGGSIDISETRVDGDGRSPASLQTETQTPLDWRHVRFHGSGAVYFKIWIVNLLLTLLTLGIYSAWATVRQRRYLYGSTEVAGSRFDFHGTPMQVLAGRVVAVVLLIAWTQGHLIHMALPYAVLGVVLLLFPWFLVNALRFRLRNTSLRNLRFNFTGTARGAYRVLGRYLLYGGLALAALMVFGFSIFGDLAAGEISGPDTFQAVARFMLVYVLLLVAFAFMYPSLICDIRSYSVNNTTYGNHGFSVTLRRGEFIQCYWGMIGIAMLASSAAMFVVTLGGVAVGLVVAGAGAATPAWGIFGGIFLGYLMLGLSLSFASAFWQARTFNLVYGRMRLEAVDFRSDLQMWPLAKILIGNTLLILATLGLGYPWAVTRLLKYKLEAISYRGNADDFAGPATAPESALGDEVGQAFDFDFDFGFG